MRVGSHIVPRYYLEQFASKRRPKAPSGAVWVYAKTKPPTQRGTPVVGVENGYFDTQTPTGDVLSYEVRLADHEHAAHALLPMIRNECFFFDLRSREIIAM